MCCRLSSRAAQALFQVFYYYLDNPVISVPKFIGDYLTFDSVLPALVLIDYSEHLRLQIGLSRENCYCHLLL